MALCRIAATTNDFVRTKKSCGYFCFLIGLSWLALNGARAAGTYGATTVSELTNQIAAFISQPQFNAGLWGVKVISLDSGKTIFESHADRLMSPASNCKLYVGALALDRLGPDYRIVTPILASAKPDADGTLHGDLVIAGRGDPSWNSHHAGTNFWDLFSPIVAQVRKAGVRHITGDVIGDATFLRSPPAGSGWDAEDLENYYGAEISALTLNDNYTQIRVMPSSESGEACSAAVIDPCTGLQLDNRATTLTNGAPRHIEALRFPGENIVHIFGTLPAGGAPELVDMPVPRPAEWFACALEEALRRNGITVDGGARAVYWPTSAPAANIRLGEVTSPPLRDMVRDFMKPSQNLEADLTFEQVGEAMRPFNAPAWQTSEECAVATLKLFLATNGLPVNDVRFDEGSGLSRNNLATANSTVALLQFMSKHRAGQDFMAALPLAGVDGTLRKRFKDTPAFENLRGKTGTLRWANSLSGYVTSAAGEHLAFSLMLNRYVAPPDQKKADELDHIALMLAEFSGRTDEPLAQQYATFGRLIVEPFATAPFPHPSRTNGYTYHNEFYSAREHYSDSTVAMFIPRHFRVTDHIDFVVHFHGWRHAVAGTLEEYKLIQQFADSGRNAILIVPQGPRMAPDSFGGKLEDTNGFKAFMAEAIDKLRASGALERTNFDIGNIILSGHSGGYHVMAAIVDHGGLSQNIREVWLFDALYGGTENFVAWQKAENGRLLDIYTDHGGTKEETENLMASYKAAGTRFWSGEDTAVSKRALRGNKLVFMHSNMVHDDVVARRRTFEQFMKTSCLKNK